MGSRASRLGALLAVAAVFSAAAPPGPARAQIGSDRYAAIVTEARTGAVLMAEDPDETRYPASLTKMMTVYMAFEALREGRIEPSSPVWVSATAASMPPSRLGLTPGASLTVEEAILALVTKSANDAAAALGEFLGGGSEARFGQMMTLRARSLGMARTTFRNASGLPDPDQVSTARDMALLGRRLLQDFPRQYAYFSTPHFTFRGRTHWNHNRLLQEYDGTDGIKTGYVNDSGFNLVASAQRDGVRLVAAVFGGRTGRERDRHMMAILDGGFARMGVAPREYGTNSLVAAAPPPAARRGGAFAGLPVLARAHAAALPAALRPAGAGRGNTVLARSGSPAQPFAGRGAATAATLRLAGGPRAGAGRAALEQGDGGARSAGARAAQLRLAVAAPRGAAAPKAAVAVPARAAVAPASARTARRRA